MVMHVTIDPSKISLGVLQGFFVTHDLYVPPHLEVKLMFFCGLCTCGLYGIDGYDSQEP